jgi:S-adenosylmethionine:tRNA ribosyltransferase-isomerase
MNLNEFDFDLPDELIAQHAKPRGASRLMIVDRARGTWQDGQIGDLARVLASGDLLVVNNTRVFPARLLGRRDPTGGAVECFLLEHVEPSGSEPDRKTDTWHALVSPGQKLPPGARVVFENAERAPGVSLSAVVGERIGRGRRVVTFDAPDIGPIIDVLGHVPLPPYIRRADTAEDRERYQTVYAEARGSVAAPTAGLHFDRPLLDALEQKGIARTSITLHVGYGTFKPVRVENIDEHVVDPEPYSISPDAEEAMRVARQRRGRVVAVGTTTTRALEHAALARTTSAHPTMPGGARHGVADLFIRPGHEFRAIDALVTNFHLPKSSLLMLVAAFGGRDLILAAYRHAVASGYRFYSYGDAMVVV